MGSHHHQVAILVPDDKLDCFGPLEISWQKIVKLFIRDQCCHLELMAPHNDKVPLRGLVELPLCRRPP